MTDAPDDSKRDRWELMIEAVTDAGRVLGFEENHIAQAKLLYSVADLYPILTKDKQDWVRGQLCHLLPRLSKSPEPETTFIDCLSLYKMNNPMEQYSRFVRSKFMTFDYHLQFGERIYEQVDGWLGDYMKWCSEAEVPTGFNFWAGVFTIGAAARYNFFIDRNSYFIRLNNYIILVSKKGVGKSSASNAAQDVMKRMNFMIEPDANASYEDNPRQIRFLPEDTNQTTLCRKLQTYQWLDPIMDETYRVPSVGCLMIDELGTFLGKDNFQVGKIISWLNMMEGGRDYYEYETGSQGKLILRDIALSFIGCIPQDVLHTLTDDVFGGGFTDRTMWVFREEYEQNFADPEVRDPLLANQLAKWLAPLAERRIPEALVPTPHARQWHKEWYDAQPKTVADPSIQSRKRRSNHIWRLAGILCLNDESTPWIHTRHMQLAERLLTREIMFYEKFKGLISRDPGVSLEDYILRVIHQHPGIKRGELFNILRSKKGLNPPAIKAIPYLDTLLEIGVVEVRRQGKTTQWYPVMTTSSKNQPTGPAPEE